MDVATSLEVLKRFVDSSPPNPPPQPRLNTQVAAPEIVVIGHQGHGKSSIIEGILGHHVTFTGYGVHAAPPPTLGR